MRLAPYFRAKALGLVSSTALALIAAQGALGAETASGTKVAAGPSPAPEEIVVTARKREEKIQEVPIAISAVSGKTLALQRLDRVADYSAKIANFSALQQNTRVSTLTIRGVGGNANSDGSEAGVGLIVDNVFFTHPGFSWLDFVDLDHVELARGPQGTLLGKNTTLGALVVTTKKPSFSPEANVEATYGNHNHAEFRANLSGPIVNDQLAARLTVYRETADGWVHNNATSQKFLDTDRWAVRGQLLLDQGNRFSDRLILEHYDTLEYNNYYPPVGDALTYVNGTPRNGWAQKLKTAFGYTPNLGLNQPADMEGQNRLKSRTDGISNEANWQFGQNTLTSVTAWRRLFFRPSNDSDGTPYPIFSSGYDVDVDQYSQEIRLSSPKDTRFEYQFGLYALDEDVKSNYRTAFFSKASAFLLSPALPAAILSGVESDQLGQAKTQSGAVFGQGTWHVNDRASLTAGLRYTVERKRGSNTAFSFGGASLPATLAPYRLAVVGANYAVAETKTSSSPSWLLNPSYRLSENLLAYFAYSHGEKSGAANLGAKLGDKILIQPEKSDDYEAGIKSTLLGGRAVFNTNLYWNDISGYQATLIDTSGTTTRSYLANVGSVRLRGVEAEGFVQMTDAVRFSSSFGAGEAVYLSYTHAPPPSEYTYPGAAASVDLSGTRVPFAPRFTGQIGLDYQTQIFNGYTLFGYVNEAYRSKTYLSPLSAYGRQGGYGLTNIGIGLTDPSDRYTAKIWAKNLFDKRYAAAFSPATAVTPYIAVLGDPLSFGITVSVKAF